MARATGDGILFLLGPGIDFSEVPVFRVQPAALDSESPLIVVPGPSSTLEAGVDLELPPEGIGDPPLQRRERFFAGLALGLAAQIVGAPGRVVTDLSHRYHVDRMVQLTVPARVQPVPFPGRARRLDRCGAVVAGELGSGPEPGDVVDVTEHNRRNDRSDTVQFGQRCRRRGHCRGDALFDLVELDVEASHVGEMLAGEPFSFDRDGVVADIDSFQESGSVSCADPDRGAAR